MQSEKESINNLLELISGFSDPVVKGSDWDVPENLRKDIVIERVVNTIEGVKTATDSEVLAYLSTVSLAYPLDHNHYKIYMYMFKKRCEKDGNGVPDFVKDTGELDDCQKTLLKELRDKIYKKRKQKR